VKKERVLITVKTYPTLSSTYGELVCTAGIRESDLSWVRIYPMPFRSLKEQFKYSKYQWVNLELVKNGNDGRLESYRPINIHEMVLEEKIPAGPEGWRKRAHFILNPKHLYTSKNSLLKDTRAGTRSIAVFKPSEFLKCTCVADSREWPEEKLEHCRSMLIQPGLFDADYIKETLPVRKIPYKFKIEFLDIDGIKSNLMIEDWEICQLYWNCIKSSDSEEDACKKVIQKLESLIQNTDLHLILGTTKLWHRRGMNPYLVIGLYYPPKPKPNPLGL